MVHLFQLLVETDGWVKALSVSESITKLMMPLYSLRIYPVAKTKAWSGLKVDF